MSDLSGKVALVTGASRGIGRAIAVALARAGADVAVNYRTREEAALETAGPVTALGRRSLVVAGDVSVAAEVTRLAAEVEAGLGPVDILVTTPASPGRCRWSKSRSGTSTRWSPLT